MARRIVPLTLDRFDALAAPCRTCLFWELDPVRRRRLPHGEEEREKHAWLSEVMREWGSCGRVAVVDDVPVGYLVYVPPAFAPGADCFPTAPVSADAVLLTTVWIDPRHAGGGLGRMLVQGMARDLIHRGGVKAIEAFGDVGPISGVHGRRCAAPADFLAAVGFQTRRAHPSAPRFRMELKNAVTWRDEVEGAWERIWDAVRPHHKHGPAPVPVPRERQETPRPRHS